MRAWRKSNKLERAASRRHAAAAGQRRNAAAPRGGGRSCRQRLRSCSELLGRPRGAALSARPLRNRLRSGVTQDGRQRRHLGVSAARRHLATPLRAAAGRKPRMMAMCHHPQQRYSRSSGINFAPPSRTWDNPSPLSLFFSFFFLFAHNLPRFKLIRSVTHNIVAGGRYRPTLRQGSYVTTPDCACSYRETHIRRRY